MAEGARLESVYTGHTVSRVRIPPSPFELLGLKVASATADTVLRQAREGAAGCVTECVLATLRLSFFFP